MYIDLGRKKMDEGFILSNKYRKSIFNEIAEGETNIKRIAKKLRIVNRVVLNIAEEFIMQGILIKKEGKYYLTEDGKKLFKIIKN